MSTGSKEPKTTERWPTALDYVLTPNIFAVIVGFALFTTVHELLVAAKSLGIIVTLTGMGLILARLNRASDSVPKDWRNAWGQVLMVHLVSGVGSLAVIEANIIWR